ncbi:hypothetical protein AG1IA_03705 [Rhizoctonia solani AG-1 IA]|uniref:Uncharacterized protein n=1 Tax=Thanatephorus cucumeris (strain AG1-IA) TaxID=983506 RepID=L8WWC4_THACA|nr:hypothetical protein AG1IA_03705 [Rhizoctonia solani AG-1 IA]
MDLAGFGISTGGCTLTSGTPSSRSSTTGTSPVPDTWLPQTLAPFGQHTGCELDSSLPTPPPPPATCMALLAAPSSVEHFVQGHHDITRLKAGLPTHSSTIYSPRTTMGGFNDTCSQVSGRSTVRPLPSQRSSVTHCSPKEQVSHCLGQYQTLARKGLDLDSAKEALFWCCLGLGTVACSQLSSTQHSPLSAQSRSGSTHSLDTISDSGFAPSFETRGSTSAPYDLSLPDVGQDFVTVLDRFGLGQNQQVKNILPFITKVSAQLLSTLQSDYDTSSSTEDTQASNLLRSQLINCNPPHSLTEPSRSLIIGAPYQDGGALGFTPFPKYDTPSISPISPIAPHIAARFQRQTRSRAASLMSHSSLRSFSSVRSLGALSPKSPATLSLSCDFRAGESPTPSGSFIMGSSGSAWGTLDSLAEDLQVRSRRREPLLPENGYSATAPSSPRRTTLSRTTSSSTDGKGKGKENAGQLPREGLRPGTANLSVRTGTRFAVTSPPTPSGLGRSKLPLPKMDPVLAALERGSKLKSKSVCLNCGKKGDNVSPSHIGSPRSGPTWCSRECRVEANNGGKHVCKRSATLRQVRRALSGIGADKFARSGPRALEPGTIFGNARLRPTHRICDMDGRRILKYVAIRRLWYNI